MALPAREQLRNLGGPPAARGLIPRQRDYLADLVPLALIRAFVHAHGPGLHVVSWIAGRQLGLVTVHQLTVAGLGKNTITRLCRCGVLQRVHRGVYLLGNPVMLPGARELAAVLACGPAAFVSHRSAAALWGVAPAVAEDVAVTVIGRGRVCKGVRTHGVAALHRADRDRMRGVPVTSVARTIIDFASEATGDELERGIAEAYARELITDRALYAAMDRVPRRAGVKAVKAELRRAGGPRWTQSEGEQRMLRLIRAARLPAPETQERIAGWPADFLWPDQRLIVEVDGYPFHNHRRAFERDRRRDQAHIAAGYRVIRVTWRQLTEEPFAVIAIIGRALGS